MPDIIEKDNKGGAGVEIQPTGRFAPTPSGRMHLGNLFSALIAWLSIRKDGGQIVLRLEDLDQNRCKAEYARQLEEDLLFLGFDWDEGGAALAVSTVRMYSINGHRYTRSSWKN